MSALDTANEIRRQRRKIRLDLKHKRRSIIDLLGEMPDVLNAATLYGVLMWIPRIGEERAQKALSAVGASEFKRFGDLTERQRKTLIEHFS